MNKCIIHWSERFRAEIRSLGRAQLNANDGISLLQVAEGALNESSGILIRMRELAIQSANGTLGTQERATLNEEFTDLREEISRIAEVTQFNGTFVLNNSGASGNVVFQVGTENTSNDEITISGVNATASSLGISAASITSASGAQAALDLLDSAINSLSSLRAGFGTVQNRLESTIRSIAVALENSSASESRIRDVDVAQETANLTKFQVLQQAGVSVLAQANQSTSIALSLLQ